MAFDLAGARALVTGASSGIGAAIARRLAREGAVVGICARRGDRLADVLEDCREASPGSLMWVQDLSRLDEVEAFARRAETDLGQVDVLVNNAGIPKRRKVADLTAEEVDAVMALNYLSPVRLTLALLPGMRERGSGRIVNVSSVAARLGPPGEAAYAASKAAVTAFSECLAVELWDEPVGVHVVNPGVIDTELFDLPDNDPLLADDVERLPPEAVAEAVVAQLADDVFEAYVPEFFADIATGRAGDVQGFLAGSAAYLAEKEGRA